MESFTLGPFALSSGLLLFFVTILLSFFVGDRVAKRYGTDIEVALWSILFVGIASARLAFVLVYWRSYVSSPWTIVDIRDGGMNTIVGISGAVLMAIVLVIKDRTRRRPILASLLTGLALWGGMTTALQAGRPATSIPEIVLPDLAGDRVSLRSLVGKPVVINLWASWCGPCRREMPVLQEAQKMHNDVVFVFANQGESSKVVRAYIDSESLRLENVLLDREGTIAKHAGSAGLPTTLFFDRHGKLVDTRVGELSRASLEQRLTQLQGP
ncbi:prolipoprotein diacylglyceryl transferase family protein [Herbaspirillum sp. GCM10030257]|uniref:prolipoprotein diacylglyceryl transferase family protein n=1 Tax=Herbaspirillum sp. GCM10030257 TaxID=3273393 RepID=UPI00361B1DBD